MNIYLYLIINIHKIVTILYINILYYIFWESNRFYIIYSGKVRDFMYEINLSNIMQKLPVCWNWYTDQS
jgi:hypothetical protein